MSLKIEDVIIIGAGPAGLSCALQLSRYGINPLIFEKDEIGGLLRNANLIENYLGFPAGISGFALTELFKKQAAVYSLNILYEKVNNVEFKQKLFYVNTNGGSYASHYLVFAAGTLPKIPDDLDLPAEVKEKILFEILPIVDYENKDIVIIGAGDLTFDYALNLGKKNNVIILNRSGKIKCIPVLLEKIKTLSNFQYIDNAKISCIKRINENLLIEYKNTNSLKNICADYILFAIGRKPNRELITHEFTESLKISGNNKRFIEIGDAANGYYRQASIASGDGIKSAMKIYEMMHEE